MGEYFVTSYTEFGTTKYVELKENGRNILITERNKEEYIELRVNWMCYGAIKLQLEEFAQGFFRVIPREYINSFGPEELEYLICGQPIIDILDWKRNTLYESPYKENHQVISWFWKSIATRSQKELANILKFCTGTDRVPIQGFEALESNRGSLSKFTIRPMTYHSKGNLYPHAHTCFNRIMLPLYSSFEELKKALDFIANNEITGFGID